MLQVCLLTYTKGVYIDYFKGVLVIILSTSPIRFWFYTINIIECKVLFVSSCGPLISLILFVDSWNSGQVNVFFFF